MTTALVLGATGFIGGHIARAALGRGWQVRGLRRRPGAVGHLDQEAIAWFEGDLDDPRSLPPAFHGADVIFHAAGYYPQSGEPVHRHVARALCQTRSVLEAACEAKASRFVYVSSLTTIGTPPPGEGRLADERDRYLPGSLPRSAYYECKYAMESEVLRADHGLASVVVCPTAVFGPGDVHLTLARLLLAVARGWVLVWLPAALNVIDVRDVAQAAARAAEIGRPGERYLLGGHNLSLQEFLIIACRLATVPPPRLGLPLWCVDAAVLLSDLLPPLRLAGNHLRAIRQWQPYNCEKAQRVLGLSPRPVETTLRDAYDWLAAQGYRMRHRSVV